MTITRYSKRKNINERESINTKLKVTDYVFNYNNEDFNNATLEYYFDKIKNVEMSYEDEKKIYNRPEGGPGSFAAASHCGLRVLPTSQRRERVQTAQAHRLPTRAPASTSEG